MDTALPFREMKYSSIQWNTGTHPQSSKLHNALVQPHLWGAEFTIKRNYKLDSTGAAAERNYPTLEVRGPAREELPHLQGAAAAWALEC